MPKIQLGDHDPYNYFPVKDGVIKVSSPAIEALPKYNDRRDKIFQFDNKFHLYRNEKIRAKGENPGKYYQTLNLIDKSEIFEFIINTLVAEWPEHFHYTNNLLLCKLTGESLHFKDKKEFKPELSQMAMFYQDGFDALGMQVQEDMVIQYANSRETDITETVSLHYPNGWSAEWAIGKSFEYIHEGVQNSKGKLVIGAPAKMVQGLVRMPKVIERVGAISFRGNTELNAHPADDHTRAWVKENPDLSVRFERQTVKSFPSIPCFLFTIKTYFVKVDRDEQTARAVIQGLETASPDVYSREFIFNNRDEIIAWLKGKFNV